MDPKTHTFTLMITTLTLIIMTIILSHIGASARNVFPKMDVCSPTPHPKLCRSIVNGMTDGKAAIKETVNTLMEETKKADDNPFIYECDEVLRRAERDLKLALECVKVNDVKNLLVNLQHALGYLSSCKDPFTVKLRLIPMADNCLHMAQNMDF